MNKIVRTYPGIELEENGGMTMHGRIIRDAWVFGILPENDGCAGRNATEMRLLIDKVQLAWEPYGQVPSKLPPELAERHMRIHDAAIKAARAKDWNPELSDDD